MEKSDKGMEIVRGKNGFLIKCNDDELIMVEEIDGDELSAVERLLWTVIEFFGLRNDDFARECVAIIREVGDEYSPADDEEIVDATYRKVVRKKSRTKRSDKKS